MSLEKQIVETLWSHYKGVYGNSILAIQQQPICNGRSVVDLAILTSVSSVGIEVKSSRDKLTRLPRQAGYYDKTFSKCILVCATKHVNEAEQLLPSHWGIQEVTNRDVILLIRPAVIVAKHAQLFHILNLLYKTELARAVKALNGCTYGDKDRLIKQLVKLAPHKVHKIVFCAFKARGNWRLKRAKATLRILQHGACFYNQPPNNKMIEKAKAEVEKQKLFKT